MKGTKEKDKKQKERNNAKRTNTNAGILERKRNIKKQLPRKEQYQRK